MFIYCGKHFENENNIGFTEKCYLKKCYFDMKGKVVSKYIWADLIFDVFISIDLPSDCIYVFDIIDEVV